MAKKDVTPKEDSDRKDEKYQSDAVPEPGSEKEVEKEGLTYVKNAHASGLGSMGRSEEKFTNRKTGEEADY